MAPGHVSKLLAPVPVKALGRMSLTLLLGALGLKPIVVEDPDQARPAPVVKTRREPTSVTRRTRCALLGRSCCHGLPVPPMRRVGRDDAGGTCGRCGEPERRQRPHKIRPGANRALSYLP